MKEHSFTSRLRRQEKWSSEEELAVQHFSESLKFDGERYEVTLHWKNNHQESKSKYTQACKRLLSIENQLSKNKERALSYTQEINQYVQDGYAEEVQTENNNREPKRVRYLPHYAANVP